MSENIDKSIVIEYITEEVTSIPQQTSHDFKRGDKVNFKGNHNYKPVNGTYIWADNCHMMICYYIQHPDGNITKEKMRRNGGLDDGFESPHSKYFKEGLNYICVTADEIEIVSVNVK